MGLNNGEKMTKLKYSILMPYYKRLGQLHYTLVSYVHYYKNRDDYEVVIAEDAKNANYMQEHQFISLLLAFFTKGLQYPFVVFQSTIGNFGTFARENLLNI